jgi:hypothetical protein
MHLSDVCDRRIDSSVVLQWLLCATLGDDTVQNA